MKTLLLFVFCLIPLLSNSQEKNAAVKKGLTKTELEHAKKLFVIMMNSETYIEMNKSIRRFSEKSPLVHDNLSEAKKIKNREEAKKFYSDWLTKNLKATEFKSVEEGLAARMEAFDLTVKNFKENTELFNLFSKATAAQFGEIREPESMARRAQILAPRH